MSKWNLEVLPTDPVEGWNAGYLRIGSGDPGGKANGLVFFNDMLQAEYDASKFPEIAASFQAATLPESVRQTLAALLELVRVPLAVRSSSVLEDAIFCPFAGVYETKVIPNNDTDPKVRMERLELAIKLVLASSPH